MDSQVCNTCGKRLPMSAYHRSSSIKTGYQRKCKACARAYNILWYSKCRKPYVANPHNKQPYKDYNYAEV